MISPYLLLWALLDKYEEEILNLQARKINELKNSLSREYIDCDFSQLSFKQIEFEYSEYIRVEPKYIRITQRKEFKKILDHRTRYLLDESIVKRIIRLWEE